MYHIADDKRSCKSAALICEGMLVCLKEKELSQITVTDLWKASGVSRATFYRLFDNVLDVLTYQCEQVISAITENLLLSPASEHTCRQMTITILTSAMEHCQLLSAVSSNQRLDIIYHALCRQIPLLRQVYRVDEQDADGIKGYFLHSVCSLISTMIDLWVQNGQKQTADELYLKFTQVTHLLDESFRG